MWEGGFREATVTLRFLLVENCSRDHRMKRNFGNKTPPLLTRAGPDLWSLSDSRESFLRFE